MADPKYNYFDEDEFRKAKPSCHLRDMSPSFMYKLDYARELAGFPFHVNSAFRDVEYEIKHGRSGTSSHCKGVAVDIRCNTYEHRIRLVKALICAGFTRIGIYSTFVHVDSDSSKPDACWL